MADTRVPRRVADGDYVVDLGDGNVEVLDFGWASTPDNIAVLDRPNGILYAGGRFSSRHAIDHSCSPSSSSQA